MVIDIHEVIRRTLSGENDLFKRWLDYRAGSDQDGRRHPAEGLDHARYGELIQELSARQLDLLCWRGLIAPRGGTILHLSRSPFFLQIRDDLVIIYDPLFEQVFYNLLDANTLLRLRYGELERLEAAGYPSTIDGVLDVLWGRIAPVQFRQQPRSAADALRDLAAVLYTGRADEATFEHLRELLPPRLADAEVRARAIDAERRVLSLALDAAKEAGAAPELVQAVEEMIAAWNPRS